MDLLIALTPGACRIHETFRGLLKEERPLRFAEFCKSHLVNGWISEAMQLGDDRIVRLRIRKGPHQYRMYIRLWSNAANVIVTGEDGTILDAMRRSPARREVSGGRYSPEQDIPAPSSGTAANPRDYPIRVLDGEGTFNQRIDRWYAEQGGALSLEALREVARKRYQSSRDRLEASLARLKAKEAEYSAPERFREYGDIIMANIGNVKPKDAWLETENFYSGETVRIKLDPKKNAPACAEQYYQQYRKAKSGLDEVQAEIQVTEAEISALERALDTALGESNPLALQRLIRRKRPASADRVRPGLSFRRKDWLIIVGRDGAENDALLRKEVKGGDFWLHTRDYAGSYVFIKRRTGKTPPLDILLDAGNLALFYSKGRNNGEGDLFYTQVKYLRRVKNGPPGLVIPTQEKNLHISLDTKRLKELELCRVEKRV